MAKIQVFTSREEKWRVKQIVSWTMEVCQSSFYLHESTGCPVTTSFHDISEKNIRSYLNALSQEWSLCICIDLTENFSKIKNLITEEWISRHKPNHYLCLLATDSYDDSDKMEEWRKKGIHICNSFYAGKQESLETQIRYLLGELHRHQEKIWTEQTDYCPSSPFYYELQE